MKKERDFTIRHLLLEDYSDEQLNVNAFSPFLRNASRQTSNFTTRQKQSSQGAYFFFGQKRFNSWPQLDYLLITTKMSKTMKTVILL